MIILAFDTAMAGCSAALYDAAREKLLAERFVAMDRGHADAVTPLIRDCMSEAKVGFGDLARIGVTVGPGTFTGVRTGLAMARGLALATGFPVVGIDSLTAIACNAPRGEMPVAVAADARRGDVYFALFDRMLDMLHKPAVLPVAQAARLLPDGAFGLIGTGANALTAEVSGKAGVRLTGPDVPIARSFAHLIAQREPGASPPEPIYLRPPDAKPQQAMADRPARFIVERASAEAASLLASLHGECFDNPWSPVEMARLMAMPGAIALMAMEAGEPCAFLLARRAADEAEILTIGTRPFARRRGAARTLLQEMQRLAKKEGAQALFIEVAESNEEAQRLYEHLGFVMAGRRKRYYEKPGGGREDARVMRKDMPS